jgi:hypothetical protein
MERELRVFGSHQEAETADAAFYASLTPTERLDILLDLVAAYRETAGEAAQRFERVVRVARLTRG